MKRHYQLIVFDWDGTVMDSTAAIARSIQAACRDLGLDAPSDAAAKHVIGLGLSEALRQSVPHVPDHRRGELVERYRHHFLSQENAMPLYDQAREVIAELHVAGRILAVATGKSRQGLQRAMQVSTLHRYFHATRTAEETHSKPNPAMLLEIMDELGVTPGNTLMIGDTTHDLQMARNAGVDAVAMTHGAHPETELRALAPLALVDDFAALRAWFLE